MLTRHQFYLYHDGPRVFARRGSEPPVVARVCETAQAAHDYVQSVLNPDRLRHDDPSLGGVGFLHDSFQAEISGRSRPVVEAAYAAGGP